MFTHRVERMKKLHKLIARIAAVEADREEARASGLPVEEMDVELDALREKLTIEMNDVCPITRSVGNV